MPGPDGRHTRDELRAKIISKATFYMLDDGLPLDEAMDRACADLKREIQTEWAAKSAELLRALGIKPH